jgi:hypothetical protein
MSVAYMQKEEFFVADKVFPRVPVDKQSDRYFKYAKKGWFKNMAQRRGSATESAGSGWEVDNTPTYSCDVFAIHKDVDDKIRQNADEPINMDRDATAWVSRQMLLKKEVDFFANYFTTGVWGSDFTPPTLWDAGGSTPIDDVDQKQEEILQLTGYMPNVLLVSPKVHRILKNHATILDRIKYTERGIVTEDILASLFGVDRYLVARATQDTAAEGAAEAMSFVAGSTDALLVYAAPAPSLMAPSGGYIFTWTGMYGAGAFGNAISKFRMEHLKADRVEGEMGYDPKVVADDCGIYFNGVVS